MGFGEGGLAAAFVVLAFVAIAVAAKAYMAEYAFHAYLFAAASVASVFVIVNRYFERSDEPIPLEIDGKPNYNWGPVKLGTLLAVFWGIAGMIIYLVPLALLLGLTGLAGFLWTLKSGQYDDLDGAALRILPDDDVSAGQ